MLGSGGWQLPKTEIAQDLVLVFKGTTVELTLMVSGCRKECFKQTPPTPFLHEGQSRAYTLRNDD